MREILFRGQSADNRKWIEGFYFYKDRTQQHAIHCSSRMGVLTDREFEIIPETIGQLRYENKHGKYFDGDIYKCSGYGIDVVSEFCEITDRLMHGDTDDIGEIIGNIHDNPEIRK